MAGGLKCEISQAPLSKHDGKSDGGTFSGPLKKKQLPDVRLAF